MRAIVYVDGGRARALGRNDRDITAAFPELREAGEKLGARPAVLDGEVVARGADGMAAVRQHGLEGIVAKRLAAPYRPGRRSGDWLKVKSVSIQEVVIGEWTPDGRLRHPSWRGLRTDKNPAEVGREH